MTVSDPASPFLVGEVVPGYCGGTFSLYSYDDDLRVEGVGADWVVLRGPDGGVHFYQGSHADLRQLAVLQLHDRAHRGE